MDHMKVLEKSAKKILELSVAKGKTYIITKATEGYIIAAGRIRYIIGKGRRRRYIIEVRRERIEWIVGGVKGVAGDE